MKNKVIVFDLDGTLLDTLGDLNAACNYALSKYGYPKITLEETKTFIGNGIKKLIERSLKGKLDDFENVFLTFKEYYQENCNVLTKPYEGIYDVILYCKKRGFSMAVLSNKAQSILNILCDIYFKDCFDKIIGDRKDIEKKPSIMGLEIIAKDLNTDIKDIIYVGDSDVDIQTAKNAGCRGIFVSYGFRDECLLKKSGANVLCKTPLEIIDVLEGLI